MKDRHDKHTTDIFDGDAAEGTAAKQAGITAVIKAQRERWRKEYRQHAELFLASLRRGQTFTGEEMNSYISGQIPKPTHPNAWGGMFSGVITQWLTVGRVAETGELEKARRKRLHAHKYRVYRREA